MQTTPEYFALVTETSTLGLVIRIRGVLDIAAAPELRSALLTAEHDAVLDLGEVSFLDSSAIGVMVGAAKRFRERGDRVSLFNPSPEVQHVLGIMGLADHFDTV